jgi:hypothetical protein
MPFRFGEVDELEIELLPPLRIRRIGETRGAYILLPFFAFYNNFFFNTASESKESDGVYR